MRFNLDEPLFPLNQVLPGHLPAADIRRLEEEWKATKVDEWCAVAALTRAGRAVRSAIGAPDTAPIAMVLAVADLGENSRRPTVCRAMAAYRAAATTYEGVRTRLIDIRARTRIAPAV